MLGHVHWRVLAAVLVAAHVAAIPLPPSAPPATPAPPAAAPASRPAVAPASRPAAATTSPARPRVGDAVALKPMTWTVEGLQRSGLVYIPADAPKTETPVVFAFHGHGGSARQASLSFRIHTLWPEAIVVYLEGLPTPGALTDPEGKKSGWQNREGVEGDRDLKFFDAALESIKKDFKVDAKRIYAMGHSNGGGFTYLLWRTRPDVFAAFAPSGSFTLQPRNLKPKPAMHIAGRKDDLVDFGYQERTIEAIRKVDGCQEKGEEWAKDCVIYPSKTGTPVVTYIYDGTHKFPAEAPALIVKFFKEQGK